MRLEISEPLSSVDITAARIADGHFRGPSSFKVMDRDLPFDAELTIEFKAPTHEYPAGRYACIAISAAQRPGGPTITSAALHAIPVSAIIQRAIEDFGLVVPAEPVAPQLVRIGPRRRRHPGDDADRAARAYGIAQVCGKQPMKAVSDELGVPLGTARRLIAQARDPERGYLPPMP